MIHSRSGAPKRRITLMLAALAVTSLAGGAAAGIAVAQESPAIDDYHLKVLFSGEPAGAKLPEQVSGSESMAEIDSLRELAEHEGAQYWVGLDAQKNVCLVSFFGTTDWVSGETCTTPEMFGLHGAGLRVYGPEGIIEAYLVPDGAEVPPVAEKVAANLYVIDPSTSATDRSTVNKRVTADPAAGFNLAIFETPFSLEVPSE